MTKTNIQAKIILDSISPDRERITTFELEFPRFILSEFNTHRMLSRNTASSRAIPTSKMLELIKDNPALPISWGKNQPGMQASEELGTQDQDRALHTWLRARDSACLHTGILAELGVHKQLANRLVEPFQMVKTVCTATCWENFWSLRDHELAQPEFRELAHQMHQLYLNNQPTPVGYYSWHLPYVRD
jgi:thymidylate synthase ThyX